MSSKIAACARQYVTGKYEYNKAKTNDHAANVLAIENHLEDLSVTRQEIESAAIREFEARFPKDYAAALAKKTPVEEPAPATPAEPVKKKSAVAEVKTSQETQADASKLDVLYRRVAELELKIDEIGASAEDVEKYTQQLEKTNQRIDDIHDKQLRVAAESNDDLTDVDEEVDALERSLDAASEADSRLDSDTRDYYNAGDDWMGAPTRALKDILSDNPTTGKLLAHLMHKDQKPLVRAIASVLYQLNVNPEIIYTPDAAGARGNYANGKVTIRRDGESPQVVLHEIWHAATVTELKKASLLSMKVQRSRTSNVFDALSLEDQRLVSAYRRLEDLKDEAKVALGQEGSLSNRYKNVIEFVAEALSDPEFQNMLANTVSSFSRMPGTSKEPTASLWKRFTSAIRSLMGARVSLKGFDDSILARILEASSHFASKEMDLSGESYNAGSLDATAPSLNAATVMSSSHDSLRKVFVATREAWHQKDYGKAARLTGRGWVISAKALLRSGGEWIHTMRGLSRQHAQFYGITDLISKMHNLKARVSNDFDHRMQLFLRTMRSKDGTVTEAIVNALAGTTLRHGTFDELPKEMLKEISERVKMFMKDPSTLYTLDPQTNFPVLISGLLDKWVPTMADMEKGFALPNEGRVSYPFQEVNNNKQLSAEEKTAKKEEIYKAYRSAMDSMAQGALHYLHTADQQARARDAADVADISKRYKDTAYDSVKKLREAFDTAYRNTSEIDLEKRKYEETDAAFQALEKIRVTLHGLVSGRQPLTSDEAKSVMASFGLDEAAMKKLLDPLTALVKTKTGIDNSEVKKIVQDIYSAANGTRLKESEAISAIQTMVTSYVPIRHYGKYMMTLSFVDEKGKAVSGAVQIAHAKDNEASPRATESVLDRYQSDNLADLEEAYKVLQKDKDTGLDADTNPFVWITVNEKDETGRVKTDDTGTPVTERVRAKLQWNPPTRVNEFKSTIKRIRPHEYLSMSDTLGISLSPEAREKLVKGTTNADAAQRKRQLNRSGVPGYSKDFVRAISDHLGGIASLVAIRSYEDPIQSMIADEPSWHWTDKQEEALKEARTAHEAAASAKAKPVHTSELTQPQAWAGP